MNVTFEFVRDYRHKVLIPAAMLISIITLVLGQLLVTHIFTFRTTLSIIVNFVGGVYFIYLLLRANKKWAIEIRNITKSYGSKKVVDNVSVTIPTGKITSFIGPNGAGKSTVLSIMSRLLNADSGEIYLNGELLNRKKSSDIAKQLAILKQTNNINLRLTIEDLVAFGRFPYSKGNLTQTDRTFIDNAIAYMNLDDIRHQYIDNLSGGQRQRAYIAMTLAQDTDYIFVG